MEKRYYVLDLPPLTQQAVKSTNCSTSIKEPWLKFTAIWIDTLASWRKLLFNRTLLTTAIEDELNDFELLELHPYKKSNTLTNNRFPHKCACGSAAYFGFATAECSGCKHPSPPVSKINMAETMSDYDLLMDV